MALSYYCTPCDERHALGDFCAYWDAPADDFRDPCDDPNYAWESWNHYAESLALPRKDRDG